MPTPHGGELAAFVYHASMFLSIIVGKAKNCRPFSDKIFLNAKIAKNPVTRLTFMEKNDNSPAFFPESQQNCHLFRPIRPLFRTKKAPTPVGVRAMWVWGVRLRPLPNEIFVGYLVSIAAFRRHASALIAARALANDVLLLQANRSHAGLDIFFLHFSTFLPLTILMPFCIVFNL